VNAYTDPGQHIFWITSRALGIVALLLVATTVGLGLAMSGRGSRSPGATGRIKHLHEALSLAALGAIGGHGLLLLGDGYLHPGLAGIAVPFQLKGQPVWTGVGIVAGWLAAILGLSFYVRGWIGPKLWRWLHRWTLGVYVLALAHAIGSGPDSRSSWLLAILAATAAPIALVAGYRFLPRPAPALRT
jgi:methionine sulfoxide reductase heme-binding subunit